MDELRDALAPDTVLEGYRIDRVLGAGGFGITYLATEIETGRRVAIKEYLPAALAHREPGTSRVRPVSAGSREDFEWGLGRFRDEARMLVRFRDPAIVSTLRFFVGNGTAYLVMDYMEGETLGEALRRRSTLPEPDVAALVRPLLEGLRAVHGAGYLHRDIKPDNIFLRSDTGRPVLLDFGAARQALGQRSKMLTAIITPRYAPFEQYAEDGDQGPWTDLYALGAVLYRCIAGEAPPEAPLRIAAELRGKPDPMAPAAQRGEGRYWPSLLHAIDGALSVREHDRPQDVDAFFALLSADRAPAPAPRAVEATLVIAPSDPVAPPRASSERPERPDPLAVRRVGLVFALVLAAALPAAYFAFFDRAPEPTTASASQPASPEPPQRQPEVRPPPPTPAPAERPRVNRDGTYASPADAVASLCNASQFGVAGWSSADGQRSGVVRLQVAPARDAGGRLCCDVEVTGDPDRSERLYCRMSDGRWEHRPESPTQPQPPPSASPPARPQVNTDGTYASPADAIAALCETSRSGVAAWSSADGTRSGVVRLESAPARDAGGRLCCTVEVSGDGERGERRHCRGSDGRWARL